MNRFLLPITCVFVGMIAALVSSCARDCAAPGAYAALPPAGPAYGSGPDIQQYALPSPAPQYGSPPGTPQYGPPPDAPQYGPPPDATRYGASPR